MSSPPDAVPAPAPAPAGAGATQAPQAAWRRWLGTPEASILLVVLFLWVYMFLSPDLSPQARDTLRERFFSTQNTELLFRTVSILAIFAIGELLVILTGGIDLSIGSLVAFNGMLLGVLMNSMFDGGRSVGQAEGLAVAAVLGASLAVGLAHAFLIHSLKLPPFVVTLGSMSMLKSGALLFNNGVPIPIEKFKGILFLGNGRIYLGGLAFGIPVATLILLGVAVATMLVLAYTRMGRQVYSVGSNEEAARLSGVNVFRVRLFVYCGCSLLAGLAAIISAGYAQQGDPRAGAMLELNAISAVVIGGALLTGGRGSVAGTLLGALLLESLISMINFRIGDPSRWQGMVVGGVLLLAVTVNQLRRWDLFRAGLSRLRRLSSRSAQGAS